MQTIYNQANMISIEDEEHAEKSDEIKKVKEIKASISNNGSMFMSPY